MNLQSIVLLGLILVIFGLVGYRIWKGRKHPGCSSCQVKGCVFKDKKYSKRYKASDCKQKH